MKEKLSHILLRFYNKTQDIITSGVFNPEMNKDCQKVEDTAISEIKALFPSWIPAAERLPEEHEDCLILVSKPDLYDVFLGELVDGDFYSGNYVFNKKYITHWQKLPELPKEAK